VQDYVVAENLNIGVSVFCPEYIHTDIHNSERHRPEKYTVSYDPFYASENYLNYRAGFAKNITEKGMNPAFVGPRLFRAIEDNQMYIVPHMHTHEQILRRHRAIEADLEKERALHEEFARLQEYD
jgi:short-subunit dehydrogenase